MPAWEGGDEAEANADLEVTRRGFIARALPERARGSWKEVEALDLNASNNH
jgi:hypothetical protein